MERDTYDKRCGRCGHDVAEDVVDGRRAERCLCLVSFADERMPSSWYFVYETKPAVKS